MHIASQENLKLVQKWIPEATMDNLDELNNCMNTDAIFKHGIPAAVLSAAMTQAIVPKKLKGFKTVIVAGSSLLAFMFGRVVYGGTRCQQKVFGPLIAKRENSSNFNDNINQENQQNRIVTSSDKPLEDDSSWTNFDPFLDSNVSYFDDTGSNFQQDFPAEQLTELPVEEKIPAQKKIKRHLTYDDLWMKYRDTQMKWYRDFG